MRKTAQQSAPETVSEDRWWTTAITNRKPVVDFQFREMFEFRDLYLLFVRRDFVALYKQTILGPLWYIIEPLTTTVVFTLVFGRIANISTEGVPHLPYYMSGVIVWNYFAESLRTTSGTFTQHAGIFAKVYFPRIIVPLSTVTSGLIKFSIQMGIFLCFWAYYLAAGEGMNPGPWIAYVPLLIFQILITGLAIGLIISSLTAKYRDLFYLVGFGVQVWMYATPIVYPLTVIPEQYQIFYFFNPMTAVVENFRFAFLGVGSLDPLMMAIGWSVSIVLFVSGLLMFNRSARSFIDTV
ncbi:MAG: ABC transporter permease [Leptospirales bacterium]|jgi:lipopolysaccharide transport system permease protein